MKWNKTVASTCRYGDVIGTVFKDADIIWEHSEQDYQGFANVLGAMPDGTFVHYEWTYGSCSGCDDWEARRLSDEQILDEVKKAMNVLPSRQVLKKYVHGDESIKDMNYPCANSSTNGSIPGMLHASFGGRSEDFVAMREAVLQWLQIDGWNYK